MFTYDDELHGQTNYSLSPSMYLYCHTEQSQRKLILDVLRILE